MKSALAWWAGPAAAFALLALLRLFLPLAFVIEVLIFSIYTIGCSFLLGRVGFISFGQPAYLAIGAYGTGFYLYYFGTNPYVGLLAGIGAGVLLALIVGPLFVRLRSDYFALVNLALAVIVFYLMQKVLADITKGDNGLWFLTNNDRRGLDEAACGGCNRTLALAAAWPATGRGAALAGHGRRGSGSRSLDPTCLNTRKAGASGARHSGLPPRRPAVQSAGRAPARPTVARWRRTP